MKDDARRIGGLTRDEWKAKAENDDPLDDLVNAAFPEPDRSLFDLYDGEDNAGYRLEQAMLDAFGGVEACKFDDWGFDSYDRSVELMQTENGWRPTDAERAACWKAGIAQLWVSYLDGTAMNWYNAPDQKYSAGGPCSHRDGRDPGRCISLRRALHRIKELEAPRDR